MKKQLVITILLFSVFLSAKAQTGVYMTYDDFKNGNLIKAYQEAFKIKPLKHMVALRVPEGGTKDYNYSDIWGMLIDGKLNRFANSPSGGTVICELTMMTDNYALWLYTETIHEFGKPDRELTVNFISYKLDGEMVYFGMTTKIDKLAEHKGFKPLTDCVKSGKQKLMGKAIKDCIEKDPTLILDIKGIVPPVK